MQYKILPLECVLDNLTLQLYIDLMGTVYILK
jgi:hypothetical protein